MRPSRLGVRERSPRRFFSLGKMAKNDPFSFDFLTLGNISIVKLEAIYMQKQAEVAVRSERRLRPEGRTLAYKY